MPFKEKIAWISVVTTILVWGTYFAFVVIGMAHGQSLGRENLIGFFAATVIQIGLVVVASIVTAVTAPQDASAGSDERDKAIARGSSATAYPVLLVGVVGRCREHSFRRGQDRHDLWHHGGDRDR